MANDSRPQTYLEVVGRPGFIDDLEKHHGYSSLLNGDLNSLQLVLSRTDTRTLFVQFQDAARSLWQILVLLPRQVGASSEADFILGFTPNAALDYDPSDLEPLSRWQAFLGKLYGWAVDSRLDSDHAQDISLSHEKHELLALLEGLDEVLLPRLRCRQKVPSTGVDR